MGTERDQMKKKQQEENTTTRIPNTNAVCSIDTTAVCSKESTAQHDTVTQRRARHDSTAPHGTARRCAAELLSYM